MCDGLEDLAYVVDECWKESCMVVAKCRFHDRNVLNQYHFIDTPHLITSSCEQLLIIVGNDSLPFLDFY